MATQHSKIDLNRDSSLSIQRKESVIENQKTVAILNKKNDFSL